jgi:hypothetical protein
VALFRRYAQKKYQSPLLLCNSLPAIGFGFLLHYVNTNRHFKNSKEVEIALKKYIQNYDKTMLFFEKEKWVSDLCADGKLASAMEMAKNAKKTVAHTAIMDEALELLIKSLK